MAAVSRPFHRLTRVFVLRNYHDSGKDSRVRNKAERYLRAGYARLLSYRDSNGGFTYWGHGDPDVALTAYALRFLNEAAQVMPVDEDVVKGARQWLIKKQQADGGWAAYHYSTQSDRRRDASLTAYVARILATTEPKVRRLQTQPSPPNQLIPGCPAAGIVILGGACRRDR